MKHHIACLLLALAALSACNKQRHAEEERKCWRCILITSGCCGQPFYNVPGIQFPDTTIVCGKTEREIRIHERENADTFASASSTGPDMYVSSMRCTAR